VKKFSDDQRAVVKKGEIADAGGANGVRGEKPDCMTKHLLLRK